MIRIGKDGVVDRVEAEELLRTLFSDPAAARSRAQAELIPDSDPFVASIGHQVLGIVLRDEGIPDDALAHLADALRLARRSGDLTRLREAWNRVHNACSSSAMPGASAPCERSSMTACRMWAASVRPL